MPSDNYYKNLVQSYKHCLKHEPYNVSKFDNDFIDRLTRACPDTKHPKFIKLINSIKLKQKAVAYLKDVIDRVYKYFEHLDIVDDDLTYENWIKSVYNQIDGYDDDFVLPFIPPSFIETEKEIIVRALRIVFNHLDNIEDKTKEAREFFLCSC